jgi:hypothetical protein
MLSVTMVSVILLGILSWSFDRLYVIMLNVALLTVFILSVVMLIVIFSDSIC